MPDTALSLDTVSFAYAGKLVLERLSLRVEQGEFVTLVGPSGSGKSTIFKLVAGLLTPSGGEIRLGQAGRPAPGRVGYMPQRDCLMPWRTVVENAAVALEAQGVAPKTARAQAAGHLTDFGLGDVAGAYPHELSGGMRQRVAFLRTALGGQDLLLLDEPFGALDALTRSTMQEWLLSLWSRLQKTVLFITHDAEEAVFLSDRVYALSGNPVTNAVEVAVDLPRPRRYELVTTPVFQAKRAVLLRELRGVQA
jgi:putative hydroxymethylpyrimidine transport system ATP-binding protein